MKQEESHILNSIGKESGFQVPEGYFEQFNEQMLAQLPEVQITDVEAKPSMWVRIRPYLYMAAMFAGVYCMMLVFNHLNSNVSGMQRVSEMSKQMPQGDNAEEFMMNGSVSDYDINYSYEDSMMMDFEDNQQPK